MGRKKISISQIENSRQRTVTFARRRAGLIKKAHELSVLCGVRVAIVIFDAKNASHVYASSGTPEELFARYLNKQFLTNESRKRKDLCESSSTATQVNEDGNGGTYGFDNNGAFVRRRLAVVNEYKVTSDGPSSENLHVKYTKQYHNPSGNNDQPEHSQQFEPARQQNMLMSPPVAPLPVRSISLLRRNGNTLPSSPATNNFNHPQLPLQDHQPRVMSAIDMNTNSIPQMPGTSMILSKSSDNLTTATRDLSSLTIMSNQQAVNNMLGITNVKSPLSIMSGSDSADEPKTKRPKSQSFSYAASNTSYINNNALMGSHSAIMPHSDGNTGSSLMPVLDDAENIDDSSLIEQFLATTDVDDLLKTNWQSANPTEELNVEEGEEVDMDDEEDDVEEEEDGDTDVDTANEDNRDKSMEVNIPNNYSCLPPTTLMDINNNNPPQFMIETTNQPSPMFNPLVGVSQPLPMFAGATNDILPQLFIDSPQHLVTLNNIPGFGMYSNQQQHSDPMSPGF